MTTRGRSERHRLAPRLRRRAVEDEHAVEVVVLVLRDARGHPLEVVRDLVAVLVLALEPDRGRAARRAR